jgi:hypothetical protein
MVFSAGISWLAAIRTAIRLKGSVLVNLIALVTLFVPHN